MGPDECDFERWEDEGGMVERENLEPWHGFRVGDYVRDMEGDEGVIETIKDGRIITERGFTYSPHELTRIADY